MFVGIRFNVTILVVTQLLLLISPASSSKILGYFITPSRSHFIIHESLMQGLAANGHNVTVVSLFPPPKEAIPNYRAIQLHMHAETETEWSQFADGLLDSASNKEIFVLRFLKIMKTLANINTDTYTNPQVEHLKREESFDLVVLGWFFNDYQIGLAAHFKCPAVIVTSTPSGKALRDYVGNPAGAAYTPMAMFQGGHMSFWQRAGNYLMSTAESLATELGMYFYMEPLYSREFPSTAYPSFAEAKKSVALVLVTSHFSQSAPSASFPSLVEVSGMHIPKSAKELPQNIKHWLDTAEHGAIFFSMGTNIKSTQITDEKRDAMLRVFSRLPQRILWKWEDEELPGRPDNVMIQNWLPQADILAHKNVRLFITHCGKGGLNEARQNGVPILGIPVFADQPSNLKEIVKEGWAVPLQYSELTETTFERALVEALSNSSYSDVVRSAAQLYSDRPMHPLDTAVYWVEYVLRHNGAKHMQSQAVHLNWVQYNSLDVLALFAAIAWVLWKLTVRFWRMVIAFVCRRKRAVKSKSE